MSKKNRFKNRRSARISEPQKAEHVQKHVIETSAGDYNMTSDFIWLFAIIFLYAGMVVALYYYDIQTHVLSSLTDKVISLL